MINHKYKKIYDDFISKYKEIHICPFHEISEDELKQIYDNLVECMDIDNEYNFKYFMDYIIKRLNGSSDAHTKYERVSVLPINFRIFEGDVIVNYPDDLKGCKLLEINKIDINDIVSELEKIVTYGTEGKKKYEIEKALFNRYVLFSLPSLRGSNKLSFKIESRDSKIIEKVFEKEQNFSKDELFDYDKYRFGDNASYEIKDNYLLYRHTSVQPKYKELIEKTIEHLSKMDLKDIDTIIVDIRGNTGGYSSLNKPLREFIEKKKFNKIICLTDYRVFSGGRYALRDLIDLGAITIGEEISTPLNCFGNSNWFNIDNHYFSVSSAYLHPFAHWQASSKEEFASEVTDELLSPLIFKPDIAVTQSKEDYLNGEDTIENYAISYANDNEFSKNR